MWIGLSKDVNALKGDRSGTIFALASGVGRAAIAVIRISGPLAEQALARLTNGRPPPARRASVRALYDPTSHERIESALVVLFPGPHSFTGETIVEFHVTGGRAVVGAVTTALAALPGLRPAEAGEFAWRAFLNGKLDLSSVEGLADLVDAETAAQRRQALRLAGGELRALADDIRFDLIEASATVEGLIDFSDVDDAEALSLVGARGVIERAATKVRRALAGSEAARRLREGFVVVIAGPPNAGKSTLINAMTKRDVAIVSPVAGTTRDAIEAFVEVDGVPVTFVDTAGLRETDDLIEKEGVRRTERHLREADMTLWLQSADGLISTEMAAPYASGSRIVLVQTKADLGIAQFHPGSIVVSAKTGAGLGALRKMIADEARSGQPPEGSLIAHERHRAAFLDCLKALERAMDSRQSEAELIAEDLRLAGRALQRIAGRVDVDDVLDSIFARLCVGK